MNVNLGLTSRDRETIISIFRRYSGIERVRVFGSRAKGVEKHGSDIDLAIDGKYQASALRDDLEESSLPYFVDVINTLDCQNISLREHIDRVGKVIYEGGK